jgi:hypothetical protein
MPTLKIQLTGQLLMLELLGKIHHFGLYVLSTLTMVFLLILLMVHSLLTKFILAIQPLIDTQKLKIPVNEAHFLPPI